MIATPKNKKVKSAQESIDEEKKVVASQSIFRDPPPIQKDYGKCEVRKGKVPDYPIQSTFTASYPGSGAKMTWKLIEAMTGLVTGDDFQLNGHSNIVSIKTHYPSSEGRQINGAEKIPRAMLLIRNPLHSIPSYFNFVYEYENKLPGHSTKAPLEEWIKWRNNNFDRQVQVWRRHTEYWMEAYDKLHRMVISYEKLIDDELGPAEAMKIAEFLNRSDGVTTVAPGEVPCVWHAVIKYKKKEAARRKLSEHSINNKESRLLKTGFFANYEDLPSSSSGSESSLKGTFSFGSSESSTLQNSQLKKASSSEQLNIQENGKTGTSSSSYNYEQKQAQTSAAEPVRSSQSYDSSISSTQESSQYQTLDQKQPSNLSQQSEINKYNSKYQSTNNSPEKGAQTTASRTSTTQYKAPGVAQSSQYKAFEQKAENTSPHDKFKTSSNHYSSSNYPKIATATADTVSTGQYKTSSSTLGSKYSTTTSELQKKQHSTTPQSTTIDSSSDYQLPKTYPTKQVKSYTSQYDTSSSEKSKPKTYPTKQVKSHTSQYDTSSSEKSKPKTYPTKQVKSYTSQHDTSSSEKSKSGNTPKVKTMYYSSLSSKLSSNGTKNSKEGQLRGSQDSKSTYLERTEYTKAKEESLTEEDAIEKRTRGPQYTAATNKTQDSSESSENQPKEEKKDEIQSKRGGPKYIAPYSPQQLKDLIGVLTQLLERYRDDKDLAPILVSYIDEAAKRSEGPPEDENTVVVET